MRTGPAARNAIDPAVLVEFLDTLADYRTNGHPLRRRRHINGYPVHESDLRLIRRWRAGAHKGVTLAAASELLCRHRLSLDLFKEWAEGNHKNPVIHGRIPTGGIK